MKKVLFALLFISFSIAVEGQSYRPFPTGEAYWTTEKLDDFWQPTGEYTIYKQQGDTLIDTVSYNKLYVRYHLTTQFVYKGALREEDKKVYYFPKDSIQEYLLYDFDVQVGDTVINLYSEWNGPYEYDTLVVFAINGSEYNLWWPGFQTLIYEGIGESRGPIPKYYEGSVSGGDVLRCFSDSTGMVYNNNGPCLTGVSETPDNSIIDIYPTPANDVLYFKGNQNFQSIKILDVSGTIVLSKSINASTGELSIANFPAGLYIVELHQGDKIYRKKIIKS